MGYKYRFCFVLQHEWVFLQFFGNTVLDNGPFRIQTSISRLLCNMFGNNLNQDYGTWFGLYFVVSKEIYAEGP